MVIKSPDGSFYKTISTIEDVIEEQSPAMWFGAYAFFKATQLHGLPKDEAKELSFAVLKEWVNKPCPDFLLALFDTDNKKQQESLLRNKSITPEDLMCWILQSGRKGGLFSQYSYDGGVPEELKGRTPIMIEAALDVRNDIMHRFGCTKSGADVVLSLEEVQALIQSVDAIVKSTAKQIMAYQKSISIEN